jgi:hypothetical protein
MALTGHGTSPVLWYQGAFVYGGASGCGLLKRLIACGELKVEGKRNRSMIADANAAARTDPISVGRRLLRGGRNV